MSNIDIKKYFLDENLIFTIDREIILDTLCCSRSLRRNCIFLLDQFHNLLEYNCATKHMVSYENQNKLQHIEDLEYNNQTLGNNDIVKIAIDENMIYLVVFVIRKNKRY